MCALIAPYAADRAEMRRQVMRHGQFVEVHLSTPLIECERRDPKGLYARARAGEIKHMTGIDDPYEAPHSPDLQFDGQKQSADDMAREIINYLVDRGALPA